MGAVVLTSDQGSHFIKLVSLKNSSVAWSQEMYENFEYQQPK